MDQLGKAANPAFGKLDSEINIERAEIYMP